MPSTGNEDILKALMFGVKTQKPRTKIKTDTIDEDALRIRVLPKSIQDIHEETAKNVVVEDTGVDIFKDHRLTTVENPHGLLKQQEQQDKKAELIKEVRRMNAILTWGDSIPDPIIDFDSSIFPDQLVQNIKEFGIKEPSPIQMQAMAVMMEKRDLLACAPTGSGKTLAFTAPIIAEIVRLKKLDKYSGGGKLLSIVLEPTRELAVQTYRQFLKFSQGLEVTVATLDEQEELAKADVIVGTPKKLVELLSSLSLKWLRWLVVDESDRLFDNISNKKGKNDETFRSQLGTIYKACNGKWAKKAFFSATFSQEVEKWCKESIVSLAIVCIGERNVANSNVVQELVYTGSEQGKLIALRNLFLEDFNPPALVFVQSKDRARQLESWFSSLKPAIPYAIISSDCRQEDRDAALNGVRSGKIWALVCTELMGRGLDLPAVNLVINFDLPTTIVQYIHRIGRTGRAGRKGHAITYFTQRDFKYVRPIASVIRQAGFSVPEYTLTLNPIARKEKKEIYRHAIKRKNIAAPRKRTAKKSSNEKMQKKRRKST